MFHKKQKPDTDQDRLGRHRSARTVERGTSATVFSYHASRSARTNATGRIDPQATAPATAARGKQSRFSRMPVLFAVGLFAVLCIINTTLGSTPHVQVMGTAAVPLRPADAYNDAAGALVRESALNKNKLTINTGHIQDKMRKQFPELTDVMVSVPFVGMTPVVHVTPGVPVLLLNAGSQLYALDIAGRALIRASEVPNIEKLDLPVVVDNSGLAVTAGKPALPASNVAFITEVIGQLQAKGLTITSVTLPAGTSEMDVRVSGVGYLAKFNLQGDGRVEAGSYLATKAQLEHTHTVPADYIDLRVEGRAYYK
jgi:hypothetical protein